ncbi:MAG: RSP_2648 family PIN domain-containing protein [Maritimibacter sp.]
MREILIGAAKSGLYTPLWSPRILEEWARATRKLGDAQEVFARGEIADLKAQFPQASHLPKEGLQARLYLPDADDVHVLAAAITGGADLLITMNAKDFPRHTLHEEGLERLSPDMFLFDLLQQHPAEMRAVAQRVHGEAERLSGEVWDMRKLMKKARLPRFGKALTAQS